MLHVCCYMYHCSCLLIIFACTNITCYRKQCSSLVVVNQPNTMFWLVKFPSLLPSIADYQNYWGKFLCQLKRQINSCHLTGWRKNSKLCKHSWGVKQKNAFIDDYVEKTLDHADISTVDNEAFWICWTTVKWKALQSLTHNLSS